MTLQERVGITIMLLGAIGVCIGALAERQAKRNRETRK